MTFPWPSWHPEQELKAEHLVALEHYLLSRVLMADEGAWGIESMDDLQQCIQVEPVTTGWIVRVMSVRGVTPAGGHVWLSEQDCIDTKTDSRGERGVFDLWIVVNSRERNSG